MERLTIDEAIKHAKEIARANRVEAENYIPTTGPYYNANLECANQHEQISMWLEELKSYKDLEEQGLLVRLPCPIGTTVWDIFKKEIRETKVTSIEYNDNKEYVLWAREDELLGTLNEAVFLTREEAEKKLEEMKNGL